MNIDALIEKIKPKFIVNFYEIYCEFRSNSLYTGIFFTLREAQQGIEGRAYKLVWAPFGWRGGTKHWPQLGPAL